MESLLISGDITLEEVAEALRKCLPGKKITVAPGKLDAGQQFSKTEVVVGRTERGYHQLLDELAEKDRTIGDTEEAAAKAVTNLQALHKQQQDLFNQFVLLRQRYDDLKQSTVSILWNQCAKFHPELRQIPPMEEPGSFIETEDQVGHYVIGDLLGEGQFATVRSCSLDGATDDGEYAIKMIKKESISSFTSLTRVSNEIDNLRILKSSFVVSVIQVIHTQSMLYLITEKGGSDLFEFFEEHPDGVPESWAREIIGNVLRGVMYCHEQEICHRGTLKPLPCTSAPHLCVRALLIAGSVSVSCRSQTREYFAQLRSAGRKMYRSQALRLRIEHEIQAKASSVRFLRFAWYVALAVLWLIRGRWAD